MSRSTNAARVGNERHFSMYPPCCVLGARRTDSPLPAKLSCGCRTACSPVRDNKQSRVGGVVEEVSEDYWPIIICGILSVWCRFFYLVRRMRIVCGQQCLMWTGHCRQEVERICDAYQAGIVSYDRFMLVSGCERFAYYSFFSSYKYYRYRQGLCFLFWGRWAATINITRLVVLSRG